MDFPEGRQEFDDERRRVFDGMARMWDNMALKAPSEKIRRLIEMADVRGKVVLDVGAGTGVLVEEGLAAGPEKWIACDLSLEMLNILREKYKDRDGGLLVFLHADVHGLELGAQTVDRVICHNVFPHLRRPGRALAGLHRVLRPGGIIIISHFAGREHINNVHRNALDAVLREDMLVPAETAAGWLVEAGFEVIEALDLPDVYRIVAVRRGGGEKV